LVVPRGSAPIERRFRSARQYGGLVAGRRILVVLDNAASAEQVLPLLPGDASCTVLVTGRRTLSSLIDRHGARHMPLDVLTRADARALLAARLGEQRVAAEPDVTDELVELCGRHPLALAITARHSATYPALPLAEFAAELRDLGVQALDHDSDPTATLPAVLSWSLHHLTDRQREVFALFGIAPGPDLDLPAAASLTGLPQAEAHKVLRVLEDASPARPATTTSLRDARPGPRLCRHPRPRPPAGARPPRGAGPAGGLLPAQRLHGRTAPGPPPLQHPARLTRPRRPAAAAVRPARRAHQAHTHSS
jgi:hypothetical protein